MPTDRGPHVSSSSPDSNAARFAGRERSLCTVGRGRWQLCVGRCHSRARQEELNARARSDVVAVASGRRIGAGRRTRTATWAVGPRHAGAVVCSESPTLSSPGCILNRASPRTLPVSHRRLVAMQPADAEPSRSDRNTKFALFVGFVVIARLIPPALRKAGL